METEDLIQAENRKNGKYNKCTYYFTEINLQHSRMSPAVVV